MGRPILIVINGAPGAGKTTLLRKLTRDLELPGIGKDDIKELLFDRLGSGDREWSKDVGAVTADMVFTLLHRWLGLGHDLIIESAFYHEYAVKQFNDLQASDSARVVEVYCKTDPAVRNKRFADRAMSGTRHRGHADVIINLPEDEIQARYAPIGVGTMLEVDTTVFGDTEYEELRQQIRKFMQG